MHDNTTSKLRALKYILKMYTNIILEYLHTFAYTMVTKCIKK
jgi:hypothetical protein